MFRLENYFFMDSGKINVIIPKDGQPYVIAGKCYGRKEFADGEDIITSIVEKIIDGVAYTKNGSKYLLGKKHPDFQKYEAVFKENR